MNRDTQPAEAEATYQAGLTVRNVLVVAECGDLALDLPAATAQIRGILGADWPEVTPDAAVAALAAAVAMNTGTTDPECVAHATTDTDAALHARALLELGGSPHGGNRTVQALAAALAFDPEEDDAALTTLAVLLAVAITPRVNHA